MATWYFNSNNNASRSWNNVANWTSTLAGTGRPGSQPSVVPWKNGSTTLHADDLAMGTQYALTPQVDCDLGGTGGTFNSPEITGICSITNVEVITNGFIYGGLWTGTGLTVSTIYTSGGVYGGCFYRDISCTATAAGFTGGLFYGNVTSTDSLYIYSNGTNAPPVFRKTVTLADGANYSQITSGVFLGTVVFPTTNANSYDIGTALPSPGPVFYQAITLSDVDVLGGHYFGAVTFANATGGEV